jgi:hypothetical protein
MAETMRNRPATSRAGRIASVTLIGILSFLLIGFFPPTVSAVAPTLTIVSPANNAIIGNGSPVTVTYAVSDFNLTAPGTGGPPNPNEGHTRVFVDGTLTVETDRQTVVLDLASGAHAIELQLVMDNGSALSPDVRASLSVMVTQGPAIGTPRIEISYLEITYPTPGLVLGRDITLSFRITNFSLVPPGRGEHVPNEGHILVFLDGAYYMAVMAFRPVPFSDLPDGDHTITFRLVDDAGRALTPDASDSVTFRIQFAAVIDINPYLSITQIVLAGAIFLVLFYRDWGRNLLGTLNERIRGGKA